MEVCVKNNCVAIGQRRSDGNWQALKPGRVTRFSGDDVFDLVERCEQIVPAPTTSTTTLIPGVSENSINCSSGKVLRVIYWARPWYDTRDEIHKACAKYTTCTGFYQNRVNKKWGMIHGVDQVPKPWGKWPVNGPWDYPFNHNQINVEKCDRPPLVRNDCCKPVKFIRDAGLAGVYETREQAVGACRIDPACKGITQKFLPYSDSKTPFIGGNWLTLRGIGQPNQKFGVGVNYKTGGGVPWCQIENCEKCHATTTNPTTTTTTAEHVCKHYESENTCPSGRCNWDGDACADPPCSSHTSQDDCCGDCEWKVGQCQPAMFKACPKEGTPGTNVCPEGCTFVDNCEQCQFAAGVWKKDYSTEPWKPSTGSRPQGCFRNRKFNIKCNKFEPGSKYPNGKDKVGEKAGKWPICKVVEREKTC